MENTNNKVKLKAEGKYSAIAEYLYYNNLIPEFDEWVDNQIKDIKKKGEEKGYKSILYVIYIQVREEDLTIRAEMVGKEMEQWINCFSSHKLFLKHNYVSRKGWHKEHQENILRLFQQAEIVDLKRQNQLLIEKLNEYEDEEDD